MGPEHLTLIQTVVGLGAFMALIFGGGAAAYRIVEDLPRVRR